ncbi:MAG TPA: signal peptidase I [Oscillospiraceae bacterium]|nr:signal peptidase I [Oscillospiraceae bacterium]
MNAEDKKEEKKNKKGNEQPKDFKQSNGVLSCFEWMESIITALVIVTVVFTFLFRIVTVKGTSMSPNLQDKYRLVLSSFRYQPKRGDVVVITHTNGLKEPIIKRVIALPGQKVNIDYNKGIVYVNGKALNESAYIKNGITHKPNTSEPLLTLPQTVPAGHVFVLGDNRSISEDSRFTAVGMVDEKYILGKAEVVLFPFDHIGRIKQ